MLRKGPYAVVIILIIIIANLYIAATKTAAKDLDCKPLDPRQEVSKEIEADIQGSAKTLLKIGQAAGNLDVKYKNTVKALQDKYPTSDQLIVKKNLLYFFCTYLNSSSMSQEKKDDLFKWMTVKLHRAHLPRLQG